MAIDDDMMEGSVSSLILDSFEQSENVLSNDDLAWVDSCLIKDPEMHDEGWNSLKDALLEILSSKPELMYSSESRNDGSLGEIDMEILPSRMDADTAESPGGTYFDLGLTNEVESTSEDNPINKALRSQLFAGNAFLPNYVEGPQEGEDIGSGLDLGISAYELEQSSEDIFRVWDLVVLAEEEEEDELVKQLNKALTDNSFESIQSTQSDLEAWKKDLPSESIDDLIAGIADLSLIPYSA